MPQHFTSIQACKLGGGGGGAGALQNFYDGVVREHASHDAMWEPIMDGLPLRFLNGKSDLIVKCSYKHKSS